MRPLCYRSPNPNVSHPCRADGVGLDGQPVKDTANITRKKAQLPQQEQLEHPTPVGGSWLKNRYIVNNYILLEPLGTGSYAEVCAACGVVIAPRINNCPPYSHFEIVKSSFERPAGNRRVDLQNLDSSSSSQLWSLDDHLRRGSMRFAGDSSVLSFAIAC